MKDTDLMPYGKHKGEKMANVPAGYLLHCYREGKISPDVKGYVKENYDMLIEEEERSGR